MSLDDDARRALAATRRHGRKAEPRIQDAATHPRRFVSLVVAAEYLEVDRKTLNIWLEEGKLTFIRHGEHRRRIEVSELVAFLDRQRVERKAG